MATIKQKLAAQEIGVNGGNISQAMRVAGYSEEVSKRTDKLTKTKGWQELMEDYLSDDVLAEVHKEGLEAVSKEGDPDYSVRHKYLDTAYKLKGSYAPEKSLNMNVNATTNLSPEQVDKINQIALDE